MTAERRWRGRRRRTGRPSDRPNARASERGLEVGRREFLTAASAVAGLAGFGVGAAGSALAAPDRLPADDHLHRGHQDVIFLGITFEDTDPPGPIEDYHAAMFDPESPLGYDDYTVGEYFEAVSDGRFSIGPGPEGLVGWYQASQPSDDFHLGDAVVEALDAAIADGFDVTAYGGPNPTQVVALTFLGGGGGGVAWVGSSFERQGVQILGFCQAPARASAAEQDINYTAHEYLHLLGLPDLYQEPGTGNMGIMGSGPLVNMIPWSKVNVDLERTPAPTGWDETTAIPPSGQPGILPPQSVANQFYTVVGEPNPADDDPDFHEHYYLAYADRTGLDAPLSPAQEGLVVWHHYQSMGVEWGAENFQFATPPADGETFRASESALDASLVETDVVVENVSTDYDSLLLNDPPHRSVPAGAISAYAVDVDASRPDWLPDRSSRAAQRHGDVIVTDDVLDARVSWAAADDDVTLRLVDPTGTEHAVTEAADASFAVVRSEPLTDRPDLEGGWTLLEETAGSGDVDYYRATNYPTYELATEATVDDASLEDGTLAATVSLAFGDGTTYDYGSFGPPTADRFEVTVDGTPLEEGAVTVTEVDRSRYDLTAQVGPTDERKYDISITFVDRKAGATVRTTAARATVTGGGDGDGGPPPVGEEGALPRDLDGDERYEDVDGSGRTGSNDVVTFFGHFESDVVQGNADAFDFNGSGGVGFDDVVALFRQL